MTGMEVDVALTAAGVIRESIPVGDVKVSDIFNAASLGVGTEGELVSVYLTGNDLKCALEVDGSLAPMMKSVQLYMSGIEYSVNQNRMIFNKMVYSSWNPVNLLRNANKFTYILVAVILLLILIVVMIVKTVIRLRKRKAARAH